MYMYIYIYIYTYLHTHIVTHTHTSTHTCTRNPLTPSPTLMLVSLGMPLVPLALMLGCKLDD